MLAYHPAMTTSAPPAPTPAAGAPTIPPAALEALADALVAERALIEELTNTMERQRAAVAADDLQGVDDSVFATHRLLLNLGEARKRRRSINQLLGWREDTGVKHLEDTLGGTMPARLRAERDELQGAARRLSQAIEINRRILREALANSETFVRAMRGTPSDGGNAGYGNAAQTAYTRPDTIAISRTA